MPSSRRTFFQSLGAGALAAAAVPSASAAKISPGDWQSVRNAFDFKDDKVPMNAANLCPSPRTVAERVTRATHDIDVDCSFQNREKYKQTLEDSRAKVAVLLRVSPDEIALVRNTSEANNVINNGLDLKAGDEIVLWEQNHPTNNVAWEVRAKRFGLKLSRVSLPANPKSVDEVVGAFRKAFTPKTRVLALTHVSNSSGMGLPIRELIEEGHRHKLYVHVDGAQSWGAFNVNLRELGVDSYSASAHKWFMGPKEVGLLYVKKENIARIWPNIIAPDWGADIEPDVVGARKFESLGQRDDAALAAVGTAAEFHEQIGWANAEARVRELAQTLKQGLKEAGAKLVTPMAEEFSGGVVIIEAPAEKRQMLLDELYTKHGIAGSTSGGHRLCPHVYNTDEHVERAIKGVKALKSLLA